MVPVSLSAHVNAFILLRDCNDVLRAIALHLPLPPLSLPHAPAHTSEAALLCSGYSWLKRCMPQQSSNTEREFTCACPI